MINGNIIIAFFVMQHVLFFTSLLKKGNMEKMQDNNARIEFLRNKSDKTLDEQKEFVKLKYNQMAPTKFNVWKFLRKSIISISLFMMVYLPLQRSGFSPNFFLTLFICMILVIILNMILMRFNLQRQDGIDTLFRKR